MKSLPIASRPQLPLALARLDDDFATRLDARGRSGGEPTPASGTIGAASQRQWYATCARWAWAFVILGIALRLGRYLLRYPLWGDECMLAENFLTRDARGLIAPLDHQQVAPLGYLWLQWAAIRAFGFHEYSLRLVALISGIGSLLLVRHVAGRLFKGVAYLLPVAIYAVAYYPIRHAAEVKPYAGDSLATIAIVALAVEAWLRPGERRWLWLLALAAPLAVMLSFPAVFAAGGVSLALLWHLSLRRQWPALVPWAAFNVALCGTFVGLFWLSESARYEASADFMTVCWAECFPPLDQPLALARWLVVAHTGEMFAYPTGAQNCGSILTTLCCASGLVLLLRRGLVMPALACCGMFAVALVAAALERYPYGESSRLTQYAAPWVCLLAGVGLAAILERGREAWFRRGSVLAAVGGLAALALAIGAESVAHPYKHRADWDHREFARALWNGTSRDVAPVSADVGLGLGYFYPGCERATYACYQRIYAPKIHVDLARPASAELACVVFSVDGNDRHRPQLDAWLATMDRRYRLVEQQPHRLLLDRIGPSYGFYTIYRFEPRGTPASVARETARTPATR